MYAGPLAASPMVLEPHSTNAATMETSVLSHHALQDPVCAGEPMGEESGDETDPEMPQMVPVHIELQRKPLSAHREVETVSTRPSTGRIHNLKRRKAFRCDREALPLKLPRPSPMALSSLHHSIQSLSQCHVP